VNYSAVTEYFSYKWLRIYSVCSIHNPVLSSLFSTPDLSHDLPHVVQELLTLPGHLN